MSKPSVKGGREPSECLEEKHSRQREVHLQRPRDRHARWAVIRQPREARVARAVTMRQRGDTVRKRARGWMEGLAGRGRADAFHLCLVRRPGGF